MIYKIITGVVLGIITLFFIEKQENNNEQSLKIMVAIILILDLLFISSSFLYGIIYGLMAIGELTLGAIISQKLFLSKKEENKDLLDSIKQTERNIALYNERIEGYRKSNMDAGEKNMIAFKEKEEETLKLLKRKANLSQENKTTKNNTPEIKQQIDQVGIDTVASIYADLINLKITNLETAKQFILEELDAARSGSEEAIIFVKNSGFKEEEYIGAMQNSFEEVDGANGPQQLLLHLIMTLAPDMKLVTTFRIKIVSNIMRIWSLGQYNNKFPNMCAKTDEEELRLISLIHKNENSEYGDFLNLYRDLDSFFGHIHIDSKLNVSFERNQECSDLIKMAYGYTLRSVMAGLYVQGLLTRDTYNQARVLFNALQQTTDQNKDFQIEASKQADELIYSYNEELDEIITAVLVANMENNYDNNLKANEVYAFDQVVLLLNKMKQDYIAKLNANKLDEKIHEKQNEIISKLTKLSKSNNFKQYKMDIVPINQIWSWSFEFSKEELKLANELVSTLFELRKGDFIAPVYNIKIKENITSTFDDFDDDIPF